MWGRMAIRPYHGNEIMKYNSNKHNRRSIRLMGYDYSKSGYYFITICTYKRECILGEMINDKMIMNENGKIVESEWLRSSEIRKEIELDVYRVMPNHFHALLWIAPNVGANGHSPLRNRPALKSKSLSSLMVGFKSSVKLKINKFRNTPGVPIWQRNYYEHIIRNEKELNKIREYIINNTLKWEFDEENPKN
jgi:REP element-mobilizing transposase RayT